MKRPLHATAIALVLSVAGGAAAAQSYEFIGGFRFIGSDDRLGYAGLTYRFAGAGQSGFFLRAEVEGVDSSMFGASLRQTGIRVLGGYSWVVGGATTLSVFAGPTHVSRSVAGLGVIDETGYAVGAEVGSFVGARGYVGGIAQYSSPDEALFLRGFGSYYLNDTFGIGPDISYQAEPGFDRLSLGVRLSYVAGSNVWGLILGQARSDATGLPRDRSPMAEFQLVRSF
jgi:hypothetical protein